MLYLILLIVLLIPLAAVAKIISVKFNIPKRYVGSYMFLWVFGVIATRAVEGSYSEYFVALILPFFLHSILFLVIKLYKWSLRVIQS